jgi:hypothetical protein
LAARAFDGDYAGLCLGRTPLPAGCMAASAQGLQFAMMAGGAVLLPAIGLYLLAAQALPNEIKE